MMTASAAAYRATVVKVHKIEPINLLKALAVEVLLNRKQQVYKSRY